MGEVAAGGFRKSDWPFRLCGLGLRRRIRASCGPRRAGAHSAKMMPMRCARRCVTRPSSCLRCRIFGHRAQIASRFAILVSCAPSCACRIRPRLYLAFRTACRLSHILGTLGRVSRNVKQRDIMRNSSSIARMPKSATSLLRSYCLAARFLYAEAYAHVRAGAKQALARGFWHHRLPTAAASA